MKLLNDNGWVKIESSHKTREGWVMYTDNTSYILVVDHEKNDIQLFDVKGKPIYFQSVEEAVTYVALVGE